MSDDVTRFREQCFLFVCNKLDSAEMAAMAAILARHPELGAEVAAERALVAQARAGLAASYQAAPPLLSYADMMAAVKADRASTRRGPLARLAAWWTTSSRRHGRALRWPCWYWASGCRLTVSTK